MATLPAGASTIQLRLSTGDAIAGTPAQLLALLSENNVVFNEAGLDNDFRIEGLSITDLFVIDAGADNVLINSSVSATTAKGHLHISNGTSPTAVLTDGVVMGSKNSGTGGSLAVQELWIEEPPETIGTFTPSHKFKIWINGVEYFVQLDAV